MAGPLKFFAILYVQTTYNKSEVGTMSKKQETAGLPQDGTC